MQQSVLLYEKEIEVKWSDMDALGHVNNANYFSYLEHCRASWFASLDLMVSSKKDITPKKLTENGNGAERMEIANTPAVVLAHVEMDYLISIEYPATIIVRMFGGAPSRSSLQTTYDIIDAHNRAMVYATSQAVLVWFDVAMQKSVPIPDNVRAYLMHT